MATSLLADLLGKSILSAELNSFMKKFGLPTNPERNLDYHGKVYDTSSNSKRNGIYLNFDGYDRHKLEYGEPDSVSKKPTDELFLDEITVDNNFLNTRKPSVADLPFGLLFGDTQKLVVQKLGKKPYDKSLTSYGHCWWTQFEDFRILTAFSPDFELIWVRIMKLTSNEKEKIKLKKYLTQQNKNINPENNKRILEYSGNLPTLKWNRRKKDGDNLFTDKGIVAVESLLKEYLLTLSELTAEKKAAVIYNSIKRIVTSLNKINAKNGGFIETLEREELCEFINNVVRETGFDIDKNNDLTEEWREW